MDGALNTVAAIRKAVLANGYQPVAVKTGEKVPAGTAWQMRRGLPPISDIALNTGIICEGLCPADIDVDDADAVEAIVKVFDEVAGHTPLVRGRPNSPRRLLLYRAPDGTRPKKRVIKLGSLGKVELLGLGQQFVAYGMHPSGVEFEWPEAGPDIVKRSDMLVLTPEHEAEIERRLRSTFDLVAEAPEPAPTQPRAAPAPRPDNIGARERAAFEAALKAEVRNVSTAGEGQRNHTLNTAAFCLAQMVTSGWGSRQEIETALTEAAFAAGLRQPEIGKTIRSGINSGMAKPRPPLGEREGYGDAVPDIEIRLTKVGGVTINAETGEIVEEDEPDDEAEEGEAPAIDEALTHVDGVLGQIVDFITATSRRPNRRLALSAALPLCATLLGRRVATPTDSALQLYVIATYPTGGGKQHQLDAIDRLMRSADLARHIGPSQFMSMSALVKHVAQSPLSICAQDEFASILTRITEKKASAHDKGITLVLRNLFNCSFGTATTPAYAQTSSVDIVTPALSLYGPTTPEELYSAMRGKDVVSGFLNRFLVIDGGERVPDRKPSHSLRDVPDDLRAAMVKLYQIGMTGRGNLSSFVCKNTAPDPSPWRVEWQTQSAEDCFSDLCRLVEGKMERDPDLAPFITRVSEMSVRCATIRACCDNPDVPMVTRDQMEWGAKLVLQSFEHMHAQASKYMVDELVYAEFERKLIAKIKSSNKPVRMSQLHKHLSKNFRNAYDLKNAIDNLKHSGVIRVEEKPVPGGITRLISMR